MGRVQSVASDLTLTAGFEGRGSDRSASILLLLGTSLAIQPKEDV